MILLASLLLDEVLEQFAPQRCILAARVHSRNVPRERCDLWIVGDRILAQDLPSEPPLAPHLVEGVLEEMLLGHQAIQGFEELFTRHDRHSPIVSRFKTQRPAKRRDDPPPNSTPRSRWQFSRGTGREATLNRGQILALQKELLLDRPSTGWPAKPKLKIGLA